MWLVNKTWTSRGQSAARDCQNLASFSKNGHLFNFHLKKARILNSDTLSGYMKCLPIWALFETLFAIDCVDWCLTVRPHLIKFTEIPAPARHPFHCNITRAHNHPQSLRWIAVTEPNRCKIHPHPKFIPQPPFPRTLPLPPQQPQPQIVPPTVLPNPKSYHNTLNNPNHRPQHTTSWIQIQPPTTTQPPPTTIPHNNVS